MDKIKSNFLQDEILPFINESFPTLMEMPENLFGEVGNPWDFISGPLGELFSFLGNESSLGALMDIFDAAANSTEGAEILDSISGLTGQCPTTDHISLKYDDINFIQDVEKENHQLPNLSQHESMLSELGNRMNMAKLESSIASSDTCYEHPDIDNISDLGKCSVGFR